MIKLALTFIALLAQDAGSYVPLLQPDGAATWLASSQQCVAQVGQTLFIAACAGWVQSRTQLTQTYRLAFELRAREANATALLSLATVPKPDGTAVAVIPLKPAIDWTEYIVDVDRTVTV